MAAETISSENRIPTIHFNPFTAVQAEEPTLNRYGLDLTSTDFIKYHHNNLEAEVIGGVGTVILNRFTITLKISRKPQMSAQEVYRNTVDLYNEGNLQHFIRQASLKLKMESPAVADFVYDLTERLEQYRKDRFTYREEQPRITAPEAKEQRTVKKLLESQNLIQELEQLMKEAGVLCPKTGVQLFIASLSSKLPQVTHCVLQGKANLTDELIKQFAKVLPDEVSRYKTSLSDNVLYYAPSEGYWNQKVLMLPSVDTLGRKNTALTELLVQGKVSRMVTENTQQGTYRASHKAINGTFSFISATAKGCHGILKADNVIALPLQEPDALAEAITDREIRKHAGLTDQAKEDKTIRLLQFLFRELKTVKVINPHLEQLDITGLFNKDYRLISQFLRFTQLVTLLHQKQLGAVKSGGMHQIEVQPSHMLAVLELFKPLWAVEEKELPFIVAGTLATIKEKIKKGDPVHYGEAEFRVKDMRAKLKISPATFARHINTLYDYGRIERTGGNRREGFTYRICHWQDTATAIDQYQALKEAINSL